MEQQNNENNNNDIPVQDTVHNVQTETVQDRANEVEKKETTTTEVPIEDKPSKDAPLDPVKGKPEAIGVDKVVAMLEDADIDNPTILPGITSKDLTKLYEA